MVNKTSSSESSGIRQRTHNSVDKVMDKAESIKESGKEAMAHLKEKAIKVNENVDSRIRKNPKKSVLIAAGVGAAVGATLTGAMMRKARIKREQA